MPEYETITVDVRPGETLAAALARTTGRTDIAPLTARRVDAFSKLMPGMERYHVTYRPVMEGGRHAERTRKDCPRIEA